MYVVFLWAVVEAFGVWSFLWLTFLAFFGEEGTFAFDDDDDDEEVAEEGVEGQLPFAPPPFVGGNGELLLLLEEKL